MPEDIKALEKLLKKVSMQADRLTKGGRTSGGIADFSGGQIQGFEGAGRSTGGRSTGGQRSTGGRSSGGILEGGMIQGFEGGMIQGFEGAGLEGGILEGGRSPKGVVPPQLKRWHAHVKKVRAKYPNLSYREQLSKASESFKK